MWTRLLLVFSVAAGIRAQQDPKDLLAKVSRRVMESVDRLPEYVSTETIERKYFEPHVARPLHSCDDVAAEQKSAHRRVRLATSDTVRADVAIGAPNDMYSWVGENRYVGAVEAIQFVDDRDSRQLVLPGPTSTGGLSGLAGVIFSGQDEADFSYDGDKIEGGRLLSEFGFNVSAGNSHLRFNLPGEQITTAYDGTFLADSETEDLVRLVTRTALLPPYTGTCEVTQTLDYRRVSLDGEDFLLPVQVLARFTRPDGTEFDNRMTYSNFRRFPPQIIAAKPLASGDPRMPAQPALPPGLRFTISLGQPIHTATAGFGDRIHAVLTADMVDKSGTVLFPAGSAVDGRIIKLVRVYGKTESSYSLTIMLRWETATQKGVSQAFTARVARKGTRAGNWVVQRFSGSEGVLLKEAGGLPLRISDNGLFEMRGLKPGYVLPKEMLSVWETAAP
jgi:hypothetical protein